MKFLDRFILIIFSIIMLVISVVNCLLIFGWLNLGTVNSFVVNILNNPTHSNILLVASIVIILLSLKGIFFVSGDKNGTKGGSGILLENESGKLIVSRETIVNIVNGVAKGFESTDNVSTRVYLDKENNLKIFVDLYVHSNAVIKELSANLQKRIKEAIKKTVDLEVKEVNIRIKNIANDNKPN